MSDGQTARDGRKASLDPKDWAAFRTRAHAMLDEALNHAEGVNEGPVWTPMPDDVKAELAEPVPMTAQGTDKVCEDLLSQVLPYTTGNTHPRFLGWVHGADKFHFVEHGQAVIGYAGQQCRDHRHKNCEFNSRRGARRSCEYGNPPAHPHLVDEPSAGCDR